ncbi:MAG: uracil-DNA glycosylase [Gammaproteobacteria bacterium]|nr:uracil-DNA glycosylase [Gammaproteobacteria bacterium]
MLFDHDCRRCKRLSGFLDAVKDEYPEYHARPVAPFGCEQPRLLIVGLAPGMHGANASGRPFTGDHAGILLYETLHRYGFSNQPTSTHRNDGLKLLDCRITNAVKCLPPQNKPLPSEIKNCNGFLAKEIATLHPGTVILALGRVAHESVLKAKALALSAYPFAHGAEHLLDNELCLIDSYHCSRYNTQTRRLTTQMFDDVFAAIRRRIDTGAHTAAA